MNQNEIFLSNIYMYDWWCIEKALFKTHHTKYVELLAKNELSRISLRTIHLQRV